MEPAESYSATDERLFREEEGASEEEAIILQILEDIRKSPRLSNIFLYFYHRFSSITIKDALPKRALIPARKRVRVCTGSSSNVGKGAALTESRDDVRGITAARDNS